jgi:hypothetical protein
MLGRATKREFSSPQKCSLGRPTLWIYPKDEV